MGSIYNLCRLAMAVMTLTLVTFATDAKNIDGISYGLNSTDKKAQVKGFANGESKSKLTIPDKVTSGGVTYKVTSIAKEAFSGDDVLKTVVIGNNVETIGSKAFSESTVKTVTFGTNVKIIGESAFLNSDVVSLVFPGSLQIIRKHAFSSCVSLKNITFNDTRLTEIGQDAFAWCWKLTAVNMPESVTTLGANAFEDCQNLTSVSISSKLTAIPDNAFSGCPIKNLRIPASVTSIGYGAFSGNQTPYVYIPGTVKTIGKWAFALSTSESVALNEGITTIDDYAFSEMPNLTDVSIPNSVTSLGSRVFTRSGVQYVQLSPNTTEIPEGAFYECDLRDLNIPSGVTQIGTWAFRNNPNLRRISVAGTVKTVGTEAFSGCDIADIELHEGVEVIADKAFGSNKCTELMLPSSIKIINSNAFGSWYLTKVVTEAKVPGLLVDDGFWSDTYEKAILIVPEGCVETYRKAEGWKQFKHIMTEGQMSYVDGIGNDGAATTSEYYDLNGNRLIQPAKGEVFVTVQVSPNGERKATRTFIAK